MALMLELFTKLCLITILMLCGNVMKNPFPFIFSLFFLYTFTAIGQRHIHAAVRLITNADSVILISHVTTDENHDARDVLVAPPGFVYDTTPIVFPSFCVGEDINQAIIVQRMLLTKQIVIALASIVQKPVKKSRISSKPLCFEPHHAILIYNKGCLSYIDLCFHCSDLVTSTDLKLTNMDFKDGKWKEMKAFFIKHGLTYEMGEND